MHLRVDQVCLGKPGGGLHCQITRLRKAKVRWCKVASLNYKGVKGYCKLKRMVLKSCGGRGHKACLL